MRYAVWIKTEAGTGFVLSEAKSSDPIFYTLPAMSRAGRYTEDDARSIAATLKRAGSTAGYVMAPTA
jgi:hypothetical protein